MSSSSRPTSSGRNHFLASSMACADCFSNTASDPAAKPSGADCPARKRAPKLEVMSTMVLRKSALRPIGVGELTVLQDLQQNVLDVRVCLFDLVKQYHAVRGGGARPR